MTMIITASMTIDDEDDNDSDDDSNGGSELDEDVYQYSSDEN